MGTRLLLAVAAPTLAVAIAGIAVAWRQTDSAVREKTSVDAVGLAEFIATNFETIDEAKPGDGAREVHRAVTNVVRSRWSELDLVTGLRILGRDGNVKWSRNIEEEDRSWPSANEMIKASSKHVEFSAPVGLWPWRPGGGGRVLYPLGGAQCGTCHEAEAAMKTGVIELTIDEPALRREVAGVFSSALGLMLVFAIVLSGIVFFAVQIFVSRRVARLRAVMKRAEDGDLVVRAPPLGSDEIGGLADAFNTMLARLTDLKVVEIETQRDLEHVRVELELKNALENRVSELQALYDLARTITSTLELDEVLNRITELVPGKLNVQKFSLMLLNNEGMLEVVKAHPVGLVAAGMTFARGEGICGRAAETRKSVYVADLQTDSIFKVKDPGGSRGPGSLLAVPMLLGDEVLGVLNFERQLKADFSADEIEFFTAVADQSAMAVQNARLHARTVALTVTDPLTGIPNRRHLFTQLEAEMHRARRFASPFSLLMVDIDHFKHLNDTAGHSAGDVILRQVATTMRRSLRKVDTIARYGGEEFVVLLPQIAAAEAHEVAEKLRRSIEDTAFEHGTSQPGGHVTVSIGCATYPIDADTQSQLVDYADAALYFAKRTGRNRAVTYTRGMDLDPTRQRGPHAVRRRTGEVPVSDPVDGGSKQTS